MSRWDETWHRLREWTGGQAKSERLAAQVLLAEGFTSLDPSHPLGGRDAGKDALVLREGERWIMAVYFPRGQQPISSIRAKLLDDHAGVASNDAEGMAFVTNQELALADRKALRNAVNTPIEIYHLERVTAILDRPAMHPARAQFLDIHDPAVKAKDAAAQARLEGLLTGGDTYCYVMLYHFDLQAVIAREFAVIRKGEFALHDLRVRIRDMDRGKEVLEQRFGELNSPADFGLVQWPLTEHVYYRIFFHARNGAWNQDLQLHKSDKAACWLAATRVLGGDGRTVLFEHRDDEYDEAFGQPEWRP